jgi:hypothetical protein
LEEEAAATTGETKGTVKDGSCCFAITETAFKKIGEFNERPGTREYGRRRTGAEVTWISKTMVKRSISI